MDLLTDTHIWYLFSFLVFLVIAWKAGKNKVLDMLDGRIEDIKKEINTAESLRVEAQEMLAQYQRKHRDAMQDAEKIKQDAENQAKEIQALAQKNLQETLDRRQKQLEDRLQRMEQNALQEIQTYAAELSIKAATEIITEKLDKKTNDKLVDSSIKNIASSM